jgi:hypothetical protein
LLVPTGIAVEHRGYKLVFVAYNHQSYLKELGTLAENGASFTHGLDRGKRDTLTEVLILEGRCDPTVGENRPSPSLEQSALVSQFCVGKYRHLRPSTPCSEPLFSIVFLFQGINSGIPVLSFGTQVALPTLQAVIGFRY